MAYHVPRLLSGFFFVETPSRTITNQTFWKNFKYLADADISQSDKLIRMTNYGRNWSLPTIE
jgi:hypothetical protein